MKELIQEIKRYMSDIEVKLESDEKYKYSFYENTENFVQQYEDQIREKRTRSSDLTEELNTDSRDILFKLNDLRMSLVMEMTLIKSNRIYEIAEEMKKIIESGTEEGEKIKKQITVIAQTVGVIKNLCDTIVKLI